MLEIIMFGVGFISGMYIVTQLEKGIDENIVNIREEQMESFLDEYNMLDTFDEWNEKNHEL